MLICFIQFNNFAHEKITYLNTNELLNIGNKSFRFVTENNSLSIQDILQKKYQAQFHLQTESVFADVPSNNIYWFKFTFQNNTDYEAFLDISTSIVSYIDLYIPDSLGLYAHPIATGSMREPITKPFPNYYYWFPLGENKGQKLTYYIKMSSINGIEVPLYIGTLDSLYRKKSNNDGVSLLFLGAILIFLFYNICTFYLTRKYISLVYSLYLVFAASGSLMINNYCFLNYFFHDSTFWHQYFMIWHSPMYIFIYFFTCEYLQLKSLAKKVYYLISIQTILLIVTLCSVVFIPHNHVYIITDIYEIMVFGISCTYLFISIFLLKKGYKSSIYYVVGWTIAFFSLLITISVLRGYIPYSLLTRNFVYVGIAFEACIFSFAISNKLNLAHKKNLIFSKQRDELVIINKTKDKIFSIVSHDLRAPIATLKNLLNFEDETIFNIDTFATYKNRLIQNVDGIYFTLNNLLLWSKSQMQGSYSNPEYFDMNKLIEENINLFKNISAEKSISLIYTFNQNFQAFADYNEICLVVRNLINNALKFTNNYGTITVTIDYDSTFWVINIRDTGIGISSSNIKKIFNFKEVFSTSGIHGEMGTGLGLKLCKEMVERNGGKINVESIQDVGSNFYFTIPKKQFL